MKTALILAAAAGIALAQNLEGQPSCARPCLSSAITAAGCAPTDVACQCGPSQSAIGNLVLPCFLSNCGPTDIVSASSAGFSLCSVFSATRSGATGSATSTSGSTAATTPTATAATTSTTHTSSTSGTTSTSATTSTTSTSRTSSSSPTSTNAAATPAMLGAGAFVAFLGAVAAL